MQYEFGKAAWFEETSEGETLKQDIEKFHQEVENRIRASIEALIESQDNFLGKGNTAEVHFLEADSKRCYKIIRKIDVMARPEAADSLPPKYREIYEKKKAEREKAERSPSKAVESGTTWHVDLFTEADYLSRARQVMPEGRVKVPRPDARMEIRGRQEGEGFEIIDEMEVLLMERMDATSVDELIMKQKSLPENFDFNRFCGDVATFLEEMHGNNLYHRDLHAGNVMIDNETGDPVIIDFGRSGVSNEEEAYVEEIGPGKKMHFIRDEQMFRDKVKGPLAQYQQYQERQGNLTQSIK